MSPDANPRGNARQSPAAEPSRATNHRPPASGRILLSKVPEVTVFFWIIKVLCTTVGESAADFLNYNLNWGLTKTSIATGVVFGIALFFQMRLNRYIPAVYWLTVALISVFGTLVTDNLTDNLDVPLETSTIVFSVLLGLVFLAWYLVERTLSIHSIYTRRREAFYWLAILVTFALGTATGDLVSEGLGVGYLKTGLLCAGLIAIIGVGWRLGLDSVLAFWLAYILTRPLGASIGDYLAQPESNGGIGLGVAMTSTILLALILGVVLYLSLAKPDVIDLPSDPDLLAALDEPETAPHHHIESRRAVLLQTVITLVVVTVSFVTFYVWRSSVLDAEAAASDQAPVPSASAASGGAESSAASPGSGKPSAGASGQPGAPASTPAASPLGDMTVFITITQDTLAYLNSGKQSDATTRITDLESAWDNAEAKLKRRNSDEWHAVDDKIDEVLRQLRSTSPDMAAEKTALAALLKQMGA